jgi:hypothetical protein
MFALSWQIDGGRAGNADLAGLRAADRVTVRIQAPVSDDATVTCVIPGHDRPGREVHTELLAVDEGGLGFGFEAVCGYESTFDYSSAGGQALG